MYHDFVGNTLPPSMKVFFSGASIVLDWSMSWSEWLEIAATRSYDGLRDHKLKTGTFSPHVDAAK